jgi:diguanylate cyclase (GGDEF)-like protein/PAS domain S-box-containing protein
VPETIRLLLVEDVATDAELEVRELKRAGLRVEHRLVDSESRFREELAGFSPHVIISDFSMPNFDGMAALELARELAPDTPFIFVSGTIGEEYAIRALKSGATDYVLKTNLVRLPPAVERAVEEAKARAAQRAIERALAETRERLQSIFDSLPDVLWSVELPGERIAYVSPASAAIYGRSQEEFLRNPRLWVEVIHEADRPAVLEAWGRLLRGEAPFDVEYRIVRGDGTLRWISDRGRVIRGRDGAPVRVDGLARDISDQMAQRARLARLARIRDLLGAASASFMRVRERQAIFEEFCRIAVSRGGFSLARVVVRDHDGRLSIAAGTENSTDAFLRMLEAHNRDPASGTSLLARALRMHQPMVSNDVRNDERIPDREALTRAGNYSLAILPVQVDGELIGAVILRAQETDYFDQEEMALLGEMIGNLELALELQAKQERLNYLALYDPLTELPNRVLFRERLSQALEDARRSSAQLALTVFDIERFKRVNDTFGPSAGDELLRAVARRLREAAGDASRVARVGGDLFAVMRPDLPGPADVVRAIPAGAAALFSEPVLIKGQQIRLAAKAGIAVFPDDGADADTLFQNAEAALKRAKETGERFLFYAPYINTRVHEQIELENRLRRAIEERELFLHFQPKVDLASRQITGLEALMRWRGPDNLLVSPGQFVPVLEQTGMILEAGRLAAELAAAAYRGWQTKGLTPPRIAVNVSAVQLRQPDFVTDILGAAGGAEGGVDIEITESLLMQDVEASIAKLKALREAGLGIALDDFGTGHSSLAYLSRLPIDTVKIDRGFVRGMVEKAEDTSIVTSIISLAQALRLKTVAEGVETEEQARLLRLLRCDQMQGYLFSPPVPAERIAALLGAPAAGAEG